MPNNTRMNNRQLAAWLARGNGQVAFGPGSCVSTYHSYAWQQEYQPVVANAKIRKWGSEQWEEPILEHLNPGDYE